MQVLRYYQALLECSQRMVVLAREQAWDDLANAEAARRAIISDMPNSTLQALPLAEQQSIRALDEKIQQCDQTVRDYVLPWQESVGKLLSRLEPKH